jgi:energy-coupling factor transporter ATP-binding protein EcfA2
MSGLGDGDTKLEEVVERLALTHFWRKRCGELSGGYQRLAALAGALLVNPEYLVLDEPFAALDEHHWELAAKAIADCSAGKALTLIASPAAEELEFINRRLGMCDGSLHEERD